MAKKKIPLQVNCIKLPCIVVIHFKLNLEEDDKNIYTALNEYQTKNRLSTR